MKMTGLPTISDRKNNMKYTAIDIGTNTLLMVVAEVNQDSSFTVLEDEHSVARLGEGVDKTGIINENAIGRATTILDKYKQICNRHSVDLIKINGTSALRDAQNSSEVRERLGKIIGAEIEAIHGEVEAGLSFSGTVEDNGNSLVIDIGGGSTEYIYGKGSEIKSKQSLQMGAVRITERFFNNLPPKKEELTKGYTFIEESIKKIDIPEEDFKLYAVAGTPTTIAQVALKMPEFNFEKIHGYELNLEEIDDVLNDFNKKTLDELKTTIGVNPLRADIIGAGTMILKKSLEYFGKSSCIVSAKGLRYGILKKMIERVEKELKGLANRLQIEENEMVASLANNDLWESVLAGKIRHVIYKKMHLIKAKEALYIMNNNRHFGKIILFTDEFLNENKID